MPFNAPNVLILSPQQEKPDPIALLLDLGDFVVNPEYNCPVPQGESLNFAVFPMLAILMDAANKRVRVKIKHPQVIMKAEVHP